MGNYGGISVFCNYHCTSMYHINKSTSEYSICHLSLPSQLVNSHRIHCLITTCGHVRTARIASTIHGDSKVCFQYPGGSC